MIPPSTRAFYRNASMNMASLRARAEDLQAQIGSGERLNRSSDDPVAAARLRTLTRKDAMLSVHVASARQTSDDLGLADGALSSIADYIIRARELATQAATTTISPDQRAMIGQELTEMRAGLLSLANARDSAGRALFAGEGDNQAYSLDPATGVVNYVGTANPGELSLGDGQSVTRSVTGPEFLNYQFNGSGTDLFATIATLATAMTDPAVDPIAAANDALGSLDKGLQSVTTAQTVIGARLNWIDFNTTRFERQAELAAEQRAEAGGADLAETITRLQQTMTVLEASQASFAKLSGLSLFSVIG